MKRRDILKYTALATGTVLSAPLITSILSGCRSEVAKEKVYEPIFFNAQEFDLLKDIIDIILPKTDSPSASEVGVQNIIDTMVGTTYKEEDRITWQNNFRALLTHLNNDPEDLELKKVKGNLNLESIKKLRTEVYENEMPVKKAFNSLRQQTVAYYLSTEEIGTKFLNYLPIPGQYEPCITLAEVGDKAWAL